MANMPTAEEIEAAELLGSAAGERGRSASLNPWAEPRTAKERVLSWRWRNAWAGARSDATFFGEIGAVTGEP